jgi:iron complex transport system substrate-binding protein
MMRVALAGLALLFLAQPSAAETSADGWAIDMAGRPVAIPPHVARVACIEVLCYQKMAMLGAADRVALMVRTAAPWMAATNPAVTAIPTITGDPQFEGLLADKVDMVFFAYNARQTLDKLRSLGLAAAISQPLGRIDSAESFLEQSKRSVRLFGRILGGEAERRAEDWCAYVDQRVAFVAARLADVPAKGRPKVYYMRGPQALNTQGPGSNTFWIGELAGADMVVRDQTWSGKGTVSMEDLLGWNPDVVLVGRQYAPELVLEDERWRTVNAVRNHRVHSTPEGVFYWDGGIEQVLLLEYMAKLLYPERFADLDMVREAQDFYLRFYRYRLTDDQARLLLDGRSPDGSRANPWNN